MFRIKSNLFLPFKLEWGGYIRLDLLTAHPQTVDWLFESGLRAAFFGIETLNPKTGSAIGKGSDRTRLFDTVRKIKQRYQNQVNLHGSFIYGLPYESVQSLESTSNFLLGDDNPLDSWKVQALRINPNDQTYGSDFLSDLEKNYSKYGYTILDNNQQEQDQLIWKNEHTDRHAVQKMVDEIQKQSQQTKTTVAGWHSFSIAGLGVDLLATLNKSHNQVDWHSLDRKKMQRAIEYKQALYEKLDVPMVPSGRTVETYSQWLLSK